MGKSIKRLCSKINTIIWDCESYDLYIFKNKKKNIMYNNIKYIKLMIPNIKKMYGNINMFILYDNYISLDVDINSCDLKYHANENLLKLENYIDNSIPDIRLLEKRQNSELFEYETTDYNREKRNIYMINKNILTNTLGNTGRHIGNKATDYVKSYIWNRTKSHFGFEIIISNGIGSEVYKEFIKWLKKYDTKIDRHLKIKPGSECEYLRDVEFIMKICRGTYVYICSGKPLMKNMSVNEIIVNSNDNIENKISPTDVYVYIFGKKSHLYNKELNGLMNIKRDILTSFKVMAGQNQDEMFRIIASDSRSRKLSTIFLENQVTDKIKTHIDKFLDNEPIYQSRDLLFKTGILLEGEPGTGKTSLANAIATEYNCDLIIVDMNDFSKINTSLLSDTLNADNLRYVVLLEDIDCVIGDREDENIDKEDKTTVNKLLQFLDSNSSPTNVIFVATTNYPEKLDAAIKRDGRFDLIVEVRGIKEDRARDMCKSFDLTDDQTTKLLNSVVESYPVNQSYLQNQILKSFEKKISIVAGDDEKENHNIEAISPNSKNVTDEVWNEYDKDGKMIYGKDSNGLEDCYEYDNNGNRIYHKEPDEYDEIGNRIRR